MTDDDAPEDEPTDDSRDESADTPEESEDAAFGEPGWRPETDRPFPYTEADRRAREFDRTDREVRLERWEAAGRNSLVPLLEHHRDAVVREIEDTAAAIEGGFAPDSMHVDRLRQAIADLETTVEECLARLAEGTEPWEHAARRVPDWRLREELGLEATAGDESAGATDADAGGGADEAGGGADGAGGGADEV